MDNFYTWPLSKKYLAAHYYLSEEKPISISEAQRAQLGALHLFVSFGKYSPDHSIPDLSLCSQAERKKRIFEWKKLSILTKNTAMEKFLDLITSLFPNWTRSRKLMYDFQIEWQSLEEQGKSPEKKLEKKSILVNHSNESNFSGFRRNVGKSLITSYDFSMLESENSPHETKKTQIKVKKNKFARTQSIDIQNSMYSFKEIVFEPETCQNSLLSDSIKNYKSSLSDRHYLKHFVEDLQSHKAGNIRDTSATRFPKKSIKSTVPPLPDLEPQVNFEIELKSYRRGLLQKEFNRYRNVEPPSLQVEFERINDKISELKLTMQKLPV